MSAAAGRPADGADGRGQGGRGTGGLDVYVGRLALRVTGLDEDEARTLGRLVARDLPASLLGAAPQAHLDRVRIQVTADEPGRTDLLARRITDELGRILTRGQGPGHPGGEAVR
jgi:hypothetical protein